MLGILKQEKNNSELCFNNQRIEENLKYEGLLKPQCLGNQKKKLILQNFVEINISTELTK